MTAAPNPTDLAALAAVIRDNIHPGEEGPLTDLWLDCAGAVLAMRQPADTLASGAGADLLAVVTAGAEAFSRKAADDLYAHLLAATQDYLIDNARYNIGETINAAHRQARHDREAWGKAEARAATLARQRDALLRALKELHQKTVVGTDEERHAALNAAWAAISANGETADA